MRYPNPSALLRRTTMFPLLVLCQLFLPTSAISQGGSSDSASSDRPTGGAIVVLVRNPAGEPIRTPALVRLYSSDGMPLGQVAVISGGQATFRNIRPGSYNVEVEASGYVTAHGTATLPMTGEIDLQVYLYPESNTDPIILSDPGTPLLAPKARQEMDEGQKALLRKDLKEAQKHLEKAEH